MSAQTVRQQARRTALDAHTRVRIQRAEQDKRRSVLAVTVVQALAERDATVAACERRAGGALRALTRDEGLTVREAAPNVPIAAISTDDFELRSTYRLTGA